MADSQRTTADTAAMASAVGNVDDCHQNLTKIWNQVSSTVGDTQSGYQTAGAALFYDVMEQWGSDFNQILQNLAQIREMLTSTKVNYHGAIDTDRASANRIAARLNGGR